MNREKSLIKNTVIISIGNILTKMINFFLLPLYTAVLATEEFGLVDLITSLSSLLLPIITIQIEESIFRFLLECKDEKSRTEVISNGYIIAIVNFLAYLIICLPILPFVHNEYKYLLVINILSYGIVSILQYTSRGFKDNVTYSVSSVISGLSTILFSILFLIVFPLGARGMIIANIMGQIICTIYILFRVKIFFRIKFSLVISTLQFRDIYIEALLFLFSSSSSPSLVLRFKTVPSPFHRMGEKWELHRIW